MNAGPVEGPRAAVITISTSKARGEGADESGPALAAFAERVGARVVDIEVIPDERELIEGRLRWWCDEGGCELLLTTGGTGFAPSDVTPEATRAVIDREAPGLAEAMRLVSPPGRLSRAVAGTRGETLVLNTPGSPTGAVECLYAVLDVVPHALDLLTGGRPH